jgi:hypothetical protein
MRLYDVEQSEQTLTKEEDDIPVFEKTRAGEKLKGIKFN